MSVFNRMLKPLPAPDTLSLLGILSIASLLAWITARDIWFLRDRVSPLWVDIFVYVIALGTLAAIIFLRESGIYVWDTIYLDALFIWYSVSIAAVSWITEKRKGVRIYIGARKYRFVNASDAPLKARGWKSTVIVVLASVIFAAVGWNYFRTYYLGHPDGTAIVTLGGVLVIPSKYWLDTVTYESGTSFKDFQAPVGARIAVGRRDEIKPEFWTWLSKSKLSEKIRCGVNMVSTLDETVKTIFVYDDRHYVWFVALPESEIESSLDSLCWWRKRRADRAMSSSNPPFVRDAPKSDARSTP